MDKINHFQYSKEFPTHISVGAVVLNDKDEIMHHYHKDIPQYDWQEIYTLMRETIEPQESIESALDRGLMEEFGATAEIIGYLGPIVSHFYSKNKESKVEKTTLYFLMRLKDFDESKRDTNDLEFGSKIQFHNPEFLIPKFKDQTKRTNRSDLDESSILEKLI